MPRIQQDLILRIASNVSAFLRLDAGVGKGVPENPKDLLKQSNQKIWELQKSVSQQNRTPGKRPNSGAQNARAQQTNRLKTPAGREEVKTQPGGFTAPDEIITQPNEIIEQTHALPEPDTSVRILTRFRSIISYYKPGKMLDLGAGHGKFALEAAKLGWEVTAVDARTVRFPDPESEEDPERAELIRSVNWIQADVREFEISEGDYDLICVLGLIHHLELEAQIQFLKKCSHSLTLLRARVAPGIVVTEPPYEGLYYREPGKTRAHRDLLPGVAWGNEFSFRHTEESLLHMAQNCGYGLTMQARPPHLTNYNFYLLLPAE
jgi:2-polyprenyl-3-methyl-5-hydroxy-6-metoxy-1,4-benzoquinol methylase